MMILDFQVSELIGRDEKIRTSDPHNPIVVRYQTALHPESVQCILVLMAQSASIFDH